MNLVRFNPWSVVDLMQRDFDRCATRGRARSSSDDSRVSWAPAVDIVEEKDRFVLRADLPGVERDEINVTMDDGVLTIAGERRAESREEVDGVQRFERATGRFRRRGRHHGVERQRHPRGRDPQTAGSAAAADYRRSCLIQPLMVPGCNASLRPGIVVIGGAKRRCQVELLPARGCRPL